MNDYEKAIAEWIQWDYEKYGDPSFYDSFDDCFLVLKFIMNEYNALIEYKMYGGKALFVCKILCRERNIKIKHFGDEFEPIVECLYDFIKAVE